MPAAQRSFPGYMPFMQSRVLISNERISNNDLKYCRLRPIAGNALNVFLESGQYLFLVFFRRLFAFDSVHVISTLKTIKISLSLLPPAAP